MLQYRRILKWFLPGVGALAVLAVIGVALYSRSKDFDERVRARAVAAINEMIRGSVSVERVEGSIWRRLTLHGVVLRHDSEEVLKVPRIDISYSLLSLVFGRLRISRIGFEQPCARLEQYGDGRWNIVEALALKESEPEVKSDFAVFVRSLRLKEGEITVRLAGDEGKLYRLDKVHIEGRVDLLPAGATVALRQIAAGLTAQGQPDIALKGGLEYDGAAAAPSLRVKDFWAVSAHSRLKLNGELLQREPVAVKGEAVLEKLAPSDVTAFFPAWPVHRDLAGQLAVNGTLADLKGDLKLTAGGASVAGKFAADLTGEQPRYNATAVFNGFDLPRWIARPRLRGVASGTLQASGQGFDLAGVSADAQVEVRGASIEGWPLGAVSAQGRFQDNVASLDGRLKSPLGGAEWSGKIALKDKLPRYDLAWSVRDFDLAKAAADRPELYGKVNLQGTVKGSGFGLADLDALTDVKILPSSLGPVEIKEGSLNAAIRDKRLRVARAILNAGEATLNLNGEFGLDAGSQGKLDYRLRVGDLSPWLALAGRKVAGAVNLSGTLWGNLDDAETQGSARLAAVRWDGLAAKEGQIVFSLRRAQKRSFPEGQLTTRLVDVDAGVFMKRIDASAKLSHQPLESIQFDASAQDGGDRRHAISGSAELGADSAVVRLKRLTLTLPDGPWNLVRPATARQTSEAFAVEELSMRNGGSELSLKGRLAFSGAHDLIIVIERFPLTSLAALLPEQPKATGLIAAEARVTGTAARPEIAASARLSDATIAGQSYAGAVAAVDYRSGRAGLRVAVQQDSTRFLNGHGILPLALSWHDGWRAEFAEGMDFKAQSTGLSLAFLNAFGGKTVEGIAGELSLDLSARGSIQQPEVRGTIGLREGRLKVVPLGVEIQHIAATVVLDPRYLTVREIILRAKEGEISGSGVLALRNIRNGAVTVQLSAKRWPAIETQRYQARVDGKLDVRGSLTSPRINGDITVREGSLRPDLAMLEQSKVPLKRDETIVVVKSNNGRREATRLNGKPAAADQAVFKNAALDLTVRAPGNLWIRHPDILAELSGTVRATKPPGGDVDMTGRIDVVRGWASFQGRRFQLARGRIEFPGGAKGNPLLDIVAQHRLPQYLVQAIIGGTAEKPSLTLASQPSMEQADILSLLLFGKPIEALNQREQGSLKESAISIAGGYVAGRIANSVSEALGLDRLGVDIRQVDFSAGRVGFGSYLGGSTYVSVSQELSGEHGREVSVEYQLAPEWKIGTSTTSTGSSGIDLIWHKRY